MAGSRVFHSDLGFTRGSTRFSFARAGSPTRRAGMLASNWRLFMGCPYKCCIDYMLTCRCVSTVQPDASTTIGTQRHVPAKYTSPRTMVDATNWMPKQTTGYQIRSYEMRRALRHYTSAGIAEVIKRSSRGVKAGGGVWR